MVLSGAGSTRLVKSSICLDVNLSLVDQQGRYTLPRELLLIFLK